LLFTDFTGLRKIFRHIVIYINIALALALLLACLAVFIRPDRLWVIAFFGLAFPYFFVLNLFFILYWLIARRIAILISLVVVLFGSVYLGRIVRWPITFQSKATAQTDSLQPPHETLSVLSYNVRAFNLYDWAHNKSAAAGILDFISSTEASVVCFQEFYSRAEKRLSLREIPADTDIAPHAHIYYYFVDKSGGRYGIATYSRYPILNRGALIFDNTFNVCIYTDILWNQDTIRIYNCHLQSVRFKKGNYDFIDTVKFSYSEKKIDALRDISSRLKKAYIKRSRQVDLIAAHIMQCPHPVLVCGDFNDTPISYTYQHMRGKLKDSFMEAGHGSGNTYQGKIPSFRIDYVLHSTGLNAVDFQTIRIRYSDHYPILAKLVKSD
jgi:endonuclease/exonuclease/phosphatase (EEP) superfamily protein YafD